MTKLFETKYLFPDYVEVNIFPCNTKRDNYTWAIYKRDKGWTAWGTNKTTGKHFEFVTPKPQLTAKLFLYHFHSTR